MQNDYNKNAAQSEGSIIFNFWQYKSIKFLSSSVLLTIDMIAGMCLCDHALCLNLLVLKALQLGNYQSGQKDYLLLLKDSDISLVGPAVTSKPILNFGHSVCEAFSTYPRTYDLLHVDGLFDAESHRCEMKIVLLEMDRILKPTGYVLILDSKSFLEKAYVIGEAMRWKCHQNEMEIGAEDSKALLICQKSFWESSQIVPKVEH
ncbi:hypothetical protein O6H91_18G054500 [Diphasiastrum complanatum]|uniref:Uncharacterized protein n=1 Tax=Diphasiastrum complanatum TaxID=34168 RepID=A0ACC2B1B5_DIPCM|nr:hypothetical protein O6H91_18G054500 [Diphasiastrum complanatum]